MKKETKAKLNNKTELVFILDRSGSMGGLEQDTIGGFNSLLEKQKAQEGECFVTTVLFDNELEVEQERSILDILSIKYSFVFIINIISAVYLCIA